MRDIRALAELVYGDDCNGDEHPLHRDDPVYRGGAPPSTKRHNDSDEDGDDEDEEEEVVETIGKKRGIPIKSSQKDSQKSRRKN